MRLFEVTSFSHLEGLLVKKSRRNVVTGKVRFNVGKYYNVESEEMFTLAHSACPAVNWRKCWSFCEKRARSSSYLVNL